MLRKIFKSSSDNTHNNSNSKKNESKIVFFSNIIITIMLCIIAFFTLNFDSKIVFGENDSTVFYNGNKNTNYVTLMINVYWGTEYIDEMLNVFNEYNVKTTFFVGGTWVEKEPEMLKKMFDNGHEIGNHGYFHKDHKKLSYQQNYDEINITHKITKEVVGVEMDLFAPPSGSFNKTTIQVASDLNYKTIMWSKDTVDWRDKDEKIVLQKATKNVVGGDLILMHPTAHTLQALPKILEFYKNNNLKCVKVSENIAI